MQSMITIEAVTGEETCCGVTYVPSHEFIQCKIFGCLETCAMGATKMKPPKLPVPPLQQTLTSYLRALEPLVTPEQLRRTRAIAEEFGGPNGVGRRLQDFLLRKYRETDSWIHDFYVNQVYLDNRSSLPYLQDYSLVLSPRQFPNVTSRALYVAAAITATQRLKTRIKRGEWPVDRWRDQPLCMMQHEIMMKCYRVPQPHRDQTYISDSDSCDHIILMHRNQAYYLPLKPCENNTDMENNTVEIARSILAVLTCRPEADHIPAVGLLTALDRDVWATIRDVLLLDPTNANNLRAFENCMMVVCLDEAINTDANSLVDHDQTDAITTTIHQLFHGGGVQCNGGNRWFDKDVQMVVSEDGLIGGIFEHSCMDGTLLGIFVKTWDDEASKILQAIGEVDLGAGTTDAIQMSWHLCPVVQQRITEGGDFVNWMGKNLDYKIYVFNGYGSDWLKSVNCSPDAFVQLALQLTAFKVYGKCMNNYSSAHLRLFRFGRTDIVRPLTTEAVHWIRNFISVENSKAELARNQKLLLLFSEAMDRQTQMTTDAVTGQGFDMHLIALSEAAKEITESVPELFQDESFKTAYNFHIVSSQVPRVGDSSGAYGPDREEGRGVFYQIMPSSIDLSATSWRGPNPSVGSEEFLLALGDVLHKMKIMVDT